MTCVSGLDQVRRGGRNSDTMHNTRVFLNRVCLQGLHVRFIVGLRVRFIVVTSSSVVTSIHLVAVGLFLSMVPEPHTVVQFHDVPSPLSSQ